MHRTISCVIRRSRSEARQRLSGTWLAVLFGAVPGCQLVAGITDRSAPVDDTSSSLSCATETDCAKGELCLFGECSHTCQRDRDCPAGARCVDTNKGAACVSPNQAACSGACAHGTICEGGQCRSPCVDSVACADDQICASVGVCVGTDPTRDEGLESTGGSGGQGGALPSGGAGGTRGGTGGTGGVSPGGAGAGGQSSFDPCAGKSCGQPCTLCDPADPGCVEPAVARFCDAALQCSEGASPSCGTAGAGGGPVDAGATGGTGGGDGGVDAGPRPTSLPSAQDTCPTFATGTQTISGFETEILAGTPQTTKGPLLFAWHGTGSNGVIALSQLPTSVKDDIVARGGIVVAPTSSSADAGSREGNTATGVWYDVSDLKYADHIAACAVRDHNIDPRRIHATGCSAGGIMAAKMGILRSGYVAAVTTNSGGLTGIAGLEFQDPLFAPAVMTMHGGATDNVIVNFGDTSAAFCDFITPDGFAVDCNHGSGHCGAPASMQEKAWDFMLAHPFGTSPSPYASGLPPDFPAECGIW